MQKKIKSNTDAAGGKAEHHRQGGIQMGEWQIDAGLFDNARAL